MELNPAWTALGRTDLPRFKPAHVQKKKRNMPKRPWWVAQSGSTPPRRTTEAGRTIPAIQGRKAAKAHVREFG